MEGGFPLLNRRMKGCAADMPTDTSKIHGAGSPEQGEHQ